MIVISFERLAVIAFFESLKFSCSGLQLSYDADAGFSITRDRFRYPNFKSLEDLTASAAGSVNCWLR